MRCILPAGPGQCFMCARFCSLLQLCLQQFWEMGWQPEYGVGCSNGVSLPVSMMSSCIGWFGIGIAEWYAENRNHADFPSAN